MTDSWGSPTPTPGAQKVVASEMNDTHEDNETEDSKLNSYEQQQAKAERRELKFSCLNLACGIHNGSNKESTNEQIVETARAFYKFANTR